MKSTMLWALVLLNAVLVCAFLSRITRERRHGTTGGRRGEQSQRPPAGDREIS